MKTIRRDTLMRMVDRGEMEAKCDLHLTEDYKFDNANNFGKTEWVQARISRPVFKDERLADPDFIEGKMNLKEFDFKSNVGTAWYNQDGTIYLKVHSNLSYTLRKKAAKPRIKLYPTIIAC